MSEKVLDPAVTTPGRNKSQFSVVLEEVFGVKVNNTSDLLRVITGGFSYTTLDKFRKLSGLSMEVLAPTLGISPRTLSRRAKMKGRLSRDESDRLVSLARILSSSIELFEGDKERASLWLNRPNRALGGLTPMKMAETETGRREVEDLIGRLEHGVFS